MGPVMGPDAPFTTQNGGDQCLWILVLKRKRSSSREAPMLMTSSMPALTHPLNVLIPLPSCNVSVLIFWFHMQRFAIFLSCLIWEWKLTKPLGRQGCRCYQGDVLWLSLGLPLGQWPKEHVGSVPDQGQPHRSSECKIRAKNQCKANNELLGQKTNAKGAKARVGC